MKGLIVLLAAAALLLTTAIAGYSLTVSDGATIYAADCASCHGATDATITDPKVKSANAAQISSAFRLHTSMKNSILRTNMGVIGAGLKGQLTAKQKNAIVAQLNVFHGEDLFNAKFTDPSEITWNCSYCHGRYGDTPLYGKTYSQIMKSFRQNKLRNNMMTPLKAKYKLSELHLIAKALAVAVAPVFTNPTSGTTSIDGALLYYLDCMSCHNGPISAVQTSPDINPVFVAGSNGASVIKNAINNPANGMNSSTLTSLTDAQLQAIATAIQTDQKPADNSIYSSLTCFGTPATGGPTNHCHQGFENPPYPN